MTLEKAEPTPGPWHLLPDGYTVVDSRGIELAIVDICHNGIKEGFANARLMAAARAMDAVLEAIYDGVEGENMTMPEWLWNDVRAAIAKARGQVEL